MSPSMDVDGKVKKPLPLPLPAMNDKKPAPSLSFLSEETQVLSLVMALVLACYYAVLASYNLRDRHHHAAPPLCLEPEPVWAQLLLMRCYVVAAGAGVVGSSRALWRGIMWCSALQAPAAALIAAFVALAAAAAGHWMYGSILGRVDRPRDVFLAVEIAGVVAAAAFDLLGLLALVLGTDE